MRPACRLDPISTLLANLFVELRAALRFDRLAALAPDFLVKGAAALGLYRSAALAPDRLVEFSASFIADGLAAFAARFRHRHAAFVFLLRHFCLRRSVATRPSPGPLLLLRLGRRRP